MVGITSFEAYVPPYRLSRDEISRAWGTKSGGGERAVAKYDEDSLTMAVSATLGCMKHRPKQPDGLFFASTTSPYKEKQAAAIIAAAADLGRETRTADFTDSLRAATIAMNSAIDAVKSGTAEEIIIAASDCRMGASKSRFEQLFGEGAVALAIGGKVSLPVLKRVTPLSAKFSICGDLRGTHLLSLGRKGSPSLRDT